MIRCPASWRIDDHFFLGPCFTLLSSRQVCLPLPRKMGCLLSVGGYARPVDVKKRVHLLACIPLLEAADGEGCTLFFSPTRCDECDWTGWISSGLESKCMQASFLKLICVCTLVPGAPFFFIFLPGLPDFHPHLCTLFRHLFVAFGGLYLIFS